MTQRKPPRPRAQPKPAAESAAVRREASAGEVYASLVAYGAPLAAWAPREDLGLEEALAHGLRLSHQDATLLRALPVVFARSGARVQWPRLTALAGVLGVEAELGFLLELTGHLTRAPHLEALAQQLEHTRLAQPQHYFEPRSAAERELAELRTPDMARRWGFLLNMPLESFSSLLSKHDAQVQR